MPSGKKVIYILKPCCAHAMSVCSYYCTPFPHKPILSLCLQSIDHSIQNYSRNQNTILLRVVWFVKSINNGVTRLSTCYCCEDFRISSICFHKIILLSKLLFQKNTVAIMCWKSEKRYHEIKAEFPTFNSFPSCFSKFFLCQI